MESLGNEPITPELVLVDPELAARLRAMASTTPEWMAPPGTPPRGHPDPGHQAVANDDESSITGVADAQVLSPPPPDRVVLIEPVRSRRLQAPRPVSLVVALAAVALLLVGFLPPRQAPQLGDTTSPASASPSPLQLAWQAPGSSVSLVEIFAGGRLVHAASTRNATFDVPGWLAPGRYTWRVSTYGGPGRAVRRPGPTLDEGWFLLKR